MAMVKIPVDARIKPITPAKASYAKMREYLRRWEGGKFVYVAADGKQARPRSFMLCVKGCCESA